METAQYLSAQEVAELWGITKRRVQSLCLNNRIPGAFRIGKMWVIPADAFKPKDARVKVHEEVIEPIGASIRKARRTLRSIVDATIKELNSKGLSPVDTLQTLVVLFASKLLENFEADTSKCMKICESFFRYKININISEKINQSIYKYISENELCLDDSLSWVYQFTAKNSDDFKYNDTQFFTEKYMINILVDSVNIDANSTVIDPACGGGNFLLYSFDTFVKQTPDKDALERVKYALGKLYGYEIDPFLAYVGAFNLKLKALIYISKERDVSIADFQALHPLIFYPENESVSGFLDAEWEKQYVVNCDSNKALLLIDAFDGANVVVTNPPFRTIKGMPLEQKNYLQQHYPMSKCDMCNAFIERVMAVLPEGGKAAMVTQNSWMYLDSFTPLRVKLLSEFTIDCIWELGSNAFYDLSGEKANVALVTATKTLPGKKHQIELGLLRNMSIESIETATEKGTIQTKHVKQLEVLNNTESRFDMVSTDHLKSLQVTCDQYKNFAVPMQGTSTGDAKNLIDYYWKHTADEDWVLVSKGGGYSRFEGLNSYCVKWGKDGEYIKNTKGSAIRNANYFNETQLVFSDTGTAGLNVRILLPGQIFVASGPGIRVTIGKELSHLAFLNSRFAAFYVRLLSPKLTIAAGYIGKIPVTERLLESTVLEKCAKKCLKSKKRRLSKRPTNYEFAYVQHTKGSCILNVAKKWFLEDIEDEWTQLSNEKIIEDTIAKEMSLTTTDKQAIDEYIGCRTITTRRDEENIVISESDVTGILGIDCFPRRTKASKKSLGTDGLIEYVSQIKEISCETVYKELSKRFTWFENRYIDLYMQALVLSALMYRDKLHRDVIVDEVISNMGISDKKDQTFAKAWIESRFVVTHSELFFGNPIYYYNPTSGIFQWIEE